MPTPNSRFGETAPALYEQVKARLRAAIAAGEFLPGDRLPPETELMRQFGVSRNTVVRALNDLVAEGLLLRIRGSGTYVRRRDHRDNPASRRGDPSSAGDRSGSPSPVVVGAGVAPLRLGVVADMAVPVGNPYVTGILAGMSQVLPSLGAQAVLLGPGWDEAAAPAEAVAEAGHGFGFGSGSSSGIGADLGFGFGPGTGLTSGSGPRTETVTLLRLAANVDGLVVIAPRRQHLASLRALERHRIPFVVVGTRLDLNWHPWHNVHVDNVGAAAAVATHLLALGHRRLLCLTGDWDMQDSADRAEGFRATCLAAGLDELPGGLPAAARINPATASDPNPASHPAPPAHSDETSDTKGYFRIIQLADEMNWHLSVPAVIRGLMTNCPVQQRPTAIFAAGFSLALAARRALQELGLSVPGDVSLVGFDDSVAAAYLDPPLTTVEQPLAEMGSLAVRILVAALRGELPRPVQRTLAARLVIRGSTAAP